jgi:peptidoglycan/LPS O-acetylase OafA/YrhL
VKSSLAEPAARTRYDPASGTTMTQARTDGVSTGRFYRSQKPDERARTKARAVRITEIDGLRGVAIVLIVGYHIWFRRVSGGVDVFLLLSGFLITMTLVRGVERKGRVEFTDFYARIARRVFPPALFVLIGVMVASIVVLPQTRWRGVLSDVVASALYGVNWHLASSAVDYLASRDAASPVQHYWSLAIQAQFYLIWPVVIALALLLAAQLAVKVRPVLAVFLGIVFVLSLEYSILRTAQDQAWAYFDTFARLWELALGGLLLLALPHLRLPRVAKVVSGWVGLAALALCGAVFHGGNQFPGWAALWPTLAAALVIVAVRSGSPWGADRWLRAPALRWLGDHSYALYLCHWPVLICYLAATDRASVGLFGGLLVIVVSVALALAVRWLLEIRLRASGIGERTNLGGAALAVTCVAAVLVVSAGWQALIVSQRRDPAMATGPDYPGAAYLAYGGELPDVPYQPDALSAKDDRAAVYEQGCHQNQSDSEVLTCTFGPERYAYTIALVGGSHAAQWVPALRTLAGPNLWRIVSITKSACRFDPGHRSVNERSTASCRQWNEAVIATLAELRPDAVLTNSTTGQGGWDRTPEGFLTQWRRLADRGIPVLALRDNPWHPYDVPECVADHGPDADDCAVDRTELRLVGPAPVEARADVPANVRFIDLTDYICEPEVCRAVVGNVLVYHDSHHLSATYVRSLTAFLGAAIAEATGWAIQGAAGDASLPAGP